MFPLGTVLIPGAAIELRIFEPRYQAMLTECLVGNGTFGIVLIERGNEVGGGEQRTDVGTIARIERAEDLGNGHTGLIAVGTDRIRVNEWLPDDPFPRAEVIGWPDEPVADRADLQRRYDDCVASLRGLLAMATELRLGAAPATFDAPDDPDDDPFLLIRHTPMSTIDCHRALCAPDLLQRLDLLAPLLEDDRRVLERRLSGD